VSENQIEQQRCRSVSEAYLDLFSLKPAVFFECLKHFDN